MTQTIDSKTVNRAIKQKIWAQLKALGFSKFTTRTAWRFGSATHVVNFQSFNSYNASVLGCTTFSFAVNLGLHFDFVPCAGGTELPASDRPLLESQCIFRRPLRRHLTQPANLDPRIWAVDPDGRNVDLCVNDALGVIDREGLPWFEKLSDPITALRIVETEAEHFDKFGPNGTWGFGRPGSPRRTATITYLQKAVSERQNED